MKKLFLTIMLLAIAATAAWADEPFRQHRYDMFKHLPLTEPYAMFIGNSITDMHPWDEVFPIEGRVVNRGVSGAVSAEILDNIETFIAARPQNVFLMIGTNDLAIGIKPEQVAANVRQMLLRFKSELPETKVYVQSILPSAVGGRDLKTEEIANELLRKAAEECGAEYIDLWDSMRGIVEDKTISTDGLHLTAAGYGIWCKELEKYIGEKAIYPDKIAELQECKGSGSHSMRNSYGSVLDVPSDGVMFLGDEMLKCGEWRELLGTDLIANRASGWGKEESNGTLEQSRCAMTATLSHKRKQPKAIVLYTGSGEAAGNTSLRMIVKQYEELLADLSKLAPKSEIYVLSLMPSAGNAKRVTDLNTMMRNSIEKGKNKKLHYIDIHTALAIDDTPSPEYIMNGYLNGNGYRMVAEILVKEMEGYGFSIDLEDEHEYIEMRGRLGRKLAEKGKVRTEKMAKVLADKEISHHHFIETAYDLLSE